MKFKKYLIAALGVLTLSLAACSQKGTEPITPTTEQTQTPVAEPTYLKFIGANKVRVDVMNDNLGLRFAYGNQAITSKTDMAYNANSKVTFSGEATVEKINFIFVTETATGTSFAVNKGIEKEYLEEFLNGKSAVYANATRIYVAISTGDLNWTTGLNADLDTKLNLYK